LDFAKIKRHRRTLVPFLLLPVVAGFGSRAKGAKAAKWANGTTVLKNPKGISAFSPVLVRQHLRRVIIPK